MCAREKHSMKSKNAVEHFAVKLLILRETVSLQQFERDLRRYARLERNMLLDNHALFDKTTVCHTHNTHSGKCIQSCNTQNTVIISCLKPLSTFYLLVSFYV